MNILALLALSVSFLVQGCGASLVKMDSRWRTYVQSQPVKAIHYTTGKFDVMKAGKVVSLSLLGPMGYGMMASEMAEAGEQMRREFALKDPALTVQERLLDRLKESSTLTDVESVSSPYPKDKIENLKKQLGNGMILDFKTLDWHLVYYPLDWNHYRLGLSLRSRLVRLANGQVVWQGVCKIEGDEPSGKRSTMDELTANLGEGLKTRLDAATASCVEDLVAQYQGQKSAAAGQK